MAAVSRIARRRRGRLPYRPRWRRRNRRAELHAWPSRLVSGPAAPRLRRSAPGRPIGRALSARSLLYSCFTPLGPPPLSHISPLLSLPMRAAGMTVMKLLRVTLGALVGGIAEQEGEGRAEDQTPGEEEQRGGEVAGRFAQIADDGRRKQPAEICLLYTSDA